jgi:hypothetical protein
MPTARQRHMITETDEVAGALDAMLNELPVGTTRADALRALLMRGVQAQQNEHLALAAKRSATIARLGTKFAETWPANWRETALEEWPE